jgi:c(7)-type cytochrome triheme protein
MKLHKLITLVLAANLYAVPALAQQSGKDIYNKTCALCHASGIAGAPRYGNAGDWSPRLVGGSASLYSNALKGTAKGMPAKGGNPSYTDTDVKSAVDYMLAAVPSVPKPAPAATPPKPVVAPSKPIATPPKAVAKEDPKPEVKAEAPAPAIDRADKKPPTNPATDVPVADVNAFNRLLKPMGKRNPPPAEDGIHDPTNDGTLALLPPLTAYAGLPKSLAGNRVNWVEALATKKIDPRWDRSDPKAEGVVMDLNIVREVKGSMPDVVYPHKQHTEWLDCSNCHPALFVPQKGANAISMAAILLGEKCGVCHGKVAFPVSECRLCHSKKKDLVRPAQAAAGGAK